MKLGDLLIASGLVTQQQVADGLQRQLQTGMRLGETLIALGAISRAAFEEFMFRVPAEPVTIKATGIDEAVLVTHVLKLMLVEQLDNVGQIAQAIHLPQSVVGDLIQLGVSRALLRAVGERGGTTQYAPTDAGVRWAQQALEQSRYVGPAPVPLEEFTALVERQKIKNAVVPQEKIRQAVTGLTVTDSFIEKIGPALNAGRPILLYGPPGNGKTSIARRFAAIFDDPVYVPYAVMVGGQVIKVFDPNLHVPLTAPPDRAQGAASIIRQEQNDARWVLCRRPFVVAGGELTLEMLDLQFDAVSGVYEAPLHVKALGGCFVIDDFGRQLVQPRQLLNRWIVPMENRVDFLKLDNGKSFTIPFEELLVFSTNLEPDELMDPAFLRRLPYKIEVGAPSPKSYRAIFDNECTAFGLTLTDDLFDHVIRIVTDRKAMELAAYHPRFIVEQVVAMCQFLGQPPRLDERFVEYAIDNLKITRS